MKQETARDFEILDYRRLSYATEILPTVGFSYALSRIINSGMSFSDSASLP